MRSRSGPAASLCQYRKCRERSVLLGGINAFSGMALWFNHYRSADLDEYQLLSSRYAGFGMCDFV